MGCICNCVVGIVNCLLLTLSICFLVSGIYLNLRGNSDCEKVLTSPLLILGGLLLIISIIGLMGTSCSSTFCMYIYLTLMFLLILGVIGFTVFVFMITNHAVGKAFSDGEEMIKPKSPLDLSNWLQNKVNNENNWKKIKSCLIDAKVCTTDEHKVDVNFNIMVFFNKRIPELKVYNKSLPALQVACCKPPNSCGFVKKNETFWEIPQSGAATNSNNDDCTKWNNDGAKLCFDCSTCKGGIVDNLKREWKALAFLNVCLLTFLILVYMLGCCAFCC